MMLACMIILVLPTIITAFLNAGGDGLRPQVHNCKEESRVIHWSNDNGSKRGRKRATRRAIKWNVGDEAAVEGGTVRISKMPSGKSSSSLSSSSQGGVGGKERVESLNVVLTHAICDFDSLASAVGLAKFWAHQVRAIMSITVEDRMECVT